MNFLVIGHSVVDRIVEKEHHSLKPGGIYYTVVSLLSQIVTGDKIFLCSNINDENTVLFKDIYDRLEREFIHLVNSIPTVELLVRESGEREETYSEIVENLVLPEKDLDRFHGILINMITGYDLSLSQIKKLRKNYNGIIYFDVHTLSRGVNKNLNRYFRSIKDFKKWAECIDVLQANESELKTLSDKNEEIAIVEELLSCGINQIIITRSDNGATVFYRDQNSINSVYRKALQLNAINKVGCGDVFGAVYFYNCIKNKNIHWALEQANLYAGIFTTYSETKEIVNLKKHAHEWISKK
jgi:sugar/nucleoside kinase (ribokinase family)